MERYSRTDSGRSSRRPRRRTELRAFLALLTLTAPAAFAQSDGSSAKAPARDAAPDSAAARSAAPAPEQKSGGPGAERLEAFLEQVQTLTADFSQQIVGADGHIIEQASGSVALSRPDHFRWVYEKPFAQEVIADGKYLWIYDVELQQATRAPLDSSTASSPAMLLSGDKAVREGFDVAGAFEREGLDWVRLKPHLPGTDFKSVALGFEGRVPQRLELEDTLNQVTRIKLSNVAVNPKLKDKLFEFKPPRGVDVIGAGD